MFVEWHPKQEFDISMNSVRRIAVRTRLRKMSSNSGSDIDLKHFYRDGRKILGAALNYK